MEEAYRGGSLSESEREESRRREQQAKRLGRNVDCGEEKAQRLGA